MKAAKLDLLIQRGSTYRKAFQLQQPGGAPVNLLGSSIRAKLRKSFESSVEVDFHALIFDPLNGKYSIELSADETAALEFMTGVYDVQTAMLFHYWNREDVAKEAEILLEYYV